ncbi:MAG: hypothetical protein FWF10_09855 [Clostridiales bacterium]|nr:hypothetical protein [Clostridiales bacterium]
MRSSTLRAERQKLTLRELVLFAAFGALMFLSKIAMEWLPNIHFLGMFIAAFTLVYRKKALIPIYVFVAILGVVNGFALWWPIHLYIWLPLWGAFMLAGRWSLPKRVQIPLYMLLCGLHGLVYGTLCAPVQMLLFGLPLRLLPAWILAGLAYDGIHAAGNFAAGALILPLVGLLRKMEGNSEKLIVKSE